MVEIKIIVKWPLKEKHDSWLGKKGHLKNSEYLDLNNVLSGLEYLSTNSFNFKAIHISKIIIKKLKT